MKNKMAFADDAPVHLLRKRSAARRPSTAGWRKIGRRKFYFRSRWENNFARYLEWQKKEFKNCSNPVVSWQYEPKTFWFKGIRRGVCSYLPDFKVKYKSGMSIYCEVKGFMDRKSITKLKRMKKYFPEVKVLVIDKDWFRLASSMAAMIPGWEFS